MRIKTSSTFGTLAAAVSLVLAFGAQAQTANGGAASPPTQTWPSTSLATPSAAPATSTKDAAVLESAFTRADANADGALSPQEASRMPAIAAKFGELDKNRDGLLSKVEFTAGYLAAQ